MTQQFLAAIVINCQVSAVPLETDANRDSCMGSTPPKWGWLYGVAFCSRYLTPGLCAMDAGVPDPPRSGNVVRCRSTAVATGPVRVLPISGVETGRCPASCEVAVRLWACSAKSGRAGIGPGSPYVDIVDHCSQCHRWARRVFDGPCGTGRVDRVELAPALHRRDAQVASVSYSLMMSSLWEFRRNASSGVAVPVFSAVATDSSSSRR